MAPLLRITGRDGQNVPFWSQDTWAKLFFFWSDSDFTPLVSLFFTPMQNQTQGLCIPSMTEVNKPHAFRSFLAFARRIPSTWPQSNGDLLYYSHCYFQLGKAELVPSSGETKPFWTFSLDTGKLVTLRGIPDLCNEQCQEWVTQLYFWEHSLRWSFQCPA